MKRLSDMHARMNERGKKGRQLLMFRFHAVFKPLCKRAGKGLSFYGGQEGRATGKLALLGPKGRSRGISISMGGVEEKERKPIGREEEGEQDESTQGWRGGKRGRRRKTKSKS